MSKSGFPFPRSLQFYILLIFILLRGKKGGGSVGKRRGL